MNSIFALRFRLLLCVVGLMALVYLVNTQYHLGLNRFGIAPRDWYSLPHIFSAPFLHLNLLHLTNNIIGMLIFGGLCLLRSSRLFVLSSFYIVVITGLLVWAFARPSMHIGASGWIFGLWSLNIALGFYERNFANIAIAIFVLFFYGGMIFGVLPGEAGVSFESHLFGALSGIVTAVMVKKKYRSR